MEKLKLLLVAPKPPPHGGICRWTALLLGWLGEGRGIELRHVDISPRWRAIDDLNRLKRALGGTVQGVKDLAGVLRFLIGFRPDVMRLTTSGSMAAVRDVAVMALARVFRVPVVYHMRFGRLPELFKAGNWEWRTLRLAMGMAKRVLVLDEASREALEGEFPEGKVGLLPNGIDLRALEAGGGACGESPERACAAGEERRMVALFLGWVIPTKGVGELVEAWRALETEGWELHIAGPGGEEYRRELVELAGEAADVRFVGELSFGDAYAVMKGADLFVLPSHTEGFPNVVLEAMAAGKAIVASRVGAIPEMLDTDTPEPAGVVVLPGEVAALGDALGRVMGDKALRRELAARANAKVRRCYDTEVVFGELVGIWREAGGKPRAWK